MSEVPGDGEVRLHRFHRGGVAYKLEIVDRGIVSGGMAPATSSQWHVTVGDETRIMRPWRLADDQTLQSLEDEAVRFVAGWL